MVLGLPPGPEPGLARLAARVPGGDGLTPLVAELTTRKLRRSAHRSVIELEDDIRKWINEWNKNPKPFRWTKSADDILETLAAYCQRILDSGTLVEPIY